MNQAVFDATRPGHDKRDNSQDSPRYHLLTDLLGRRRQPLRFPEPLEQEFRTALAQESAAVFRTSVFYVMLLYLGLGLGIVVLLPGEALDLWPWGYALLGLVVLAGILLSRQRQLDSRYESYATILAITGIAITVILPGLSTDPLMRQGSMIGVMPALAVVGGMLSLRFKPAVLAMLGGGVAGLSLLLLIDRLPDWLLVNQTYTSGCMVGAILAWLAERRNRLVFLQKSLLGLEKQRSDLLAAQMQEVSRRDGLTGLANRRRFDEKLHSEWSRSQRESTVLSLMFIDVDFFKPYNDHYGHQSGDQCLQRIAEVLAAHSRRAGDLAARYGGEEFVLLYPHTGPEAAGHLAEGLRDEVARLAIEHRHSSFGHITVSIGLISMVPDPDHGPEDLIRLADHAVYQAKSAGRNQVVVANAPD